MRLLSLYLLLLSGIVLAQTTPVIQRSSSWQQILENKQGTIQCHWYDSKPFIYEDETGMKGIEYELMYNFIDYLERKHETTITVEWIKSKAFNQVYNIIRKLETPAFGITAISITEQRQKGVEFTPAYMPDISVIVTSREIPHANSIEEFNTLFNGLNAYTIHESTLEKLLMTLRGENDLRYSINYISKMGEIIDHIIHTENTFAYIDLPSYLVALENNKPVRRQYFHAIKLEGFAFIYPKGSDWSVPVNDYFTSEQFKFNISNILNKHLGAEVVSLINDLANAENMGSSEENMILSKEKDMQDQEMLEIMMKSEQRKAMRNLFIAGSIILLLTALLFFIRYKIKLKANKHLRELDREKTNLMRVVSHDVRNPVSQMVGFANIIKMEGNYLTEEHAELLNKIIEGGDRVNKMVTKILDVEALEANKVNIVLEPILLSTLLRKVVESFKKKAFDKNIAIIERIEDNLYEVIGDNTYLTQVVENLISNALKFSSSGSEIQVIATNLEKEVKIEIIDQGPGISNEEKGKLFRKFQKLSARPTAGESSTGLGLSIAKRYVEAMKGTISCDSKQGQGATFMVVLKKA